MTFGQILHNSQKKATQSQAER